MNTKKPLLLLIILASVFVFNSNILAQGSRNLEVVYPDIPGISAPKDLGVALPDYVKYIFIFSFVVIGFIILAVLIYAGFVYLTSAGNPGRLSESKERILEALLGAAILLGSYIIFTTVNPTLVQLELKTLDPAKPIILQGIYACSKKDTPPNENILLGNIEKYVKQGQESIEAAEKIGDFMVKNKCKRMSASGPFEKTMTKDNSFFFIIPDIVKEIDPQTGKETTEAVYNYGIILHSKDRQLGKCKLVTGSENSPYGPLIDFNFGAKSFTLFQRLRPDQKPESGENATLYSCLDYNNSIACEIGKKIEAKSATFNLGINDEMKKVSPLDELSQNVRSIQFTPQGKIFAVFYEDSNFGENGKCEVIESNDRNLLDNEIGRCGGSCWFIRKETEERQVKSCTPCMKSMILIEGTIIKQ
jgi:hypothetical protein